MTENTFRNFAEIATKELAPGFTATPIHTGNNTINFVDIKAGSTLALHQHPHEQYSFVLEGEFEMTIGDEKQVLNTSKFALIPSNVRHGGTAITDCRVLDIFYPVREDYR